MEGSMREEPVIRHLSITVQDPKQAAEILAELMGGTAAPFPPNPGSFGHRQGRFQPFARFLLPAGAAAKR
jgi:hypothetical protein